MKFISILPFLFGSVFSNATSDAPGPILGDYSAPGSFPSKVVLNHLAICSNVTIVDPNGCLASTFAELRIPFEYGDTLFNKRAPNVAVSQITASAFEAVASCGALGEASAMEDANILAQQYEATISYADGACWTSLTDFKTLLSIESNWIKTCAETKLPYPIPEDDINMFMMDSVHHRYILTCMLDTVFKAPASMFGLEVRPSGSSESCFPPGYAEINTVCPSILGPEAFQFCLEANEAPGDDLEMSMSSSADQTEHQHTDPTIFIEEFCDLMIQLSSDIGRGCLMDLCAFDSTTSPSTALSSSPSVAASTSPSNKVTSAPSSPPAPSDKPISVSDASVRPSSSPSATSSLSPSKSAPSGEPSEAPSPSPSSEPSIVPSTSPSSAPSLSAFPTFDIVQAVVNIEVFSTVTLNVSLADVPNNSINFLAVMEMAIESLIFPSDVTVRLPDGVRRMRRLKNGDSLKLAVQAKATRECYVARCDEFGSVTAAQIEERVSKAAFNGDLVSNIHEAAHMKNVTVLQNAVVYNFQLVNNTILVDDVETEEPGDGATGDDSTSSAPVGFKYWYQFTAALIAIMLV